MSLLVSPSQKTYEDVGLAAERIASFARSISEAHTLGHGPGTIDELWTSDFQEKAMHVYTLTIPWDYLINLADHFQATHRHMIVIGSPTHISEEWLITAEYLRTASEVILAFAPPLSNIEPRPLESATPSVMQFGLLGEAASTAGAANLEASASVVCETIRTLSPNGGAAENPLNTNEIRALHLLIAGDKITEASHKLGYSPRTLNRQLERIWKRLGVKNRNEGIALAVRRGWLEPTPE